MNPNAYNLISRIPESAGTARKAAELTLNTAASFAKQRDEMRRSGTHTAIGVTQALRGALPAALKQVRIARSTVEKIRREAANKRAMLRPADPDRADFAGAIDRQETRTFLRSLPPIERAALLTATSDVRLLQAALTASPELTLGPNPDPKIVAQIEARFAELQNPVVVAEAADLDRVADELDSIVKVALGSMRETADMDQPIFNAEVLKSAGKLWIVGDAGREQVVELDADGKATYRVATPDEVSAGVNYASAAEFLAA